MTAPTGAPAGATRAADAILAAVLPASTRRVRIRADVATSLEAAIGGPDGAIDVDVSARGDVGDAAMAIRIVDATEEGLDTGAGGRVAVRLRDHLVARGAALAAEQRLRRRGYRATRRVLWDRGQVAHLGGGGAPHAPLRPAERLPRRAVVVGRRDPDPEPTILEAAAEAAIGTAAPWPLVRSGTLVTLHDDVVLRVAVGAGRTRLARAADALSHLRTTLPRPELVPAVHAAGDAGLGAWTVESRLHGRAAAAVIDPAVEADLLELLVGLRAAGADDAASVVEIAEAVAVHLGAGRRSDGIRKAAAAAAPALTDVGGAFVHGDLWHGNLLLDRGRLVGVIDWDSAGSRRLPFLDTLHVVVAGRVPRGSRQWGSEVVAELRSPTPPALVRRYADAIGVDLDGERRRSLVIAYWLDRLAYQVTTYADRVERPRWLEQNIDVVLDELDRGAS